MEEFQLEDNIIDWNYTISRDMNRKEIGDCVEILDFLSLYYKNGGSLDMWEIEELSTNNKFMVVEIGLRNEFIISDMKIKLDIIIVNLKTKKYYKCFSGHVKIIPFN